MLRVGRSENDDIRTTHVVEESVLAFEFSEFLSANRTHCAAH